MFNVLVLRNYYLLTNKTKRRKIKKRVQAHLEGISQQTAN